jgi:hypothetical protein
LFLVIAIGVVSSITSGSSSAGKASPTTARSATFTSDATVNRGWELGAQAAVSEATAKAGPGWQVVALSTNGAFGSTAGRPRRTTLASSPRTWVVDLVPTNAADGESVRVRSINVEFVEGLSALEELAPVTVDRRPSPLVAPAVVAKAARTVETPTRRNQPVTVTYLCNPAAPTDCRWLFLFNDGTGATEAAWVSADGGRRTGAPPWAPTS